MIQVLRSELAELQTGRTELRKFGVLMAAVLLVIGGIILWRRGFTLTTATSVIGGTAAVFLGLAALAPTALRPVYKVWMALAIALGFVMTRVILTIVFFLVITPIGLLMRALGKDPLTKGPDASLDSYWIPKTYRTRDRDRLRKYY